MRQISSFLVLILLLSLATARAEVGYHFDGQFSASEQDKLRTWIGEVVTGVEDLVGPYPFDLKIRFQRVSASQPVPFAGTIRGANQGVRFRVDPRFSLDELRRDWTAPHELSHLILPFLGRKNSWFSEGFASYLQYQVMIIMGVLTESEAHVRLRQRLDKAARDYRYPDRRFVETTPRLRAEYKYPVMYWGGAVFFFRLDERLRAAGEKGVVDLLRRYMHCCRRDSAGLEQLMREFDQVLGAEDLCESELRAFRSVRGFPAPPESLRLTAFSGNQRHYSLTSATTSLRTGIGTR